uniref:Uncharacterized protein n=1 Tax=Fagus sylvatica TaxID=28930 RepID=A0A2N9GBJ8_FAGSY
MPIATLSGRATRPPKFTFSLHNVIWIHPTPIKAQGEYLGVNTEGGASDLSGFLLWLFMLGPWWWRDWKVMEGEGYGGDWVRRRGRRGGRQNKLVTETHIDLSLEFVTLVLPMGRTGQFHEPQGSWRDPSLVELEIEEDLILGPVSSLHLFDKVTEQHTGSAAEAVCNWCISAVIAGSEFVRFEREHWQRQSFSNGHFGETLDSEIQSRLSAEASIKSTLQLFVKFSTGIIQDSWSETNSPSTLLALLSVSPRHSPAVSLAHGSPVVWQGRGDSTPQYIANDSGYFKGSSSYGQEHLYDNDSGNLRGTENKHRNVRRSGPLDYSSSCKVKHVESSTSGSTGPSPLPRFAVSREREIPLPPVASQRASVPCVCIAACGPGWSASSVSSRHSVSTSPLLRGEAAGGLLGGVYRM